MKINVVTYEMCDEFKTRYRLFFCKHNISLTFLNMRNINIAFTNASLALKSG